MSADFDERPGAHPLRRKFGAFLIDKELWRGQHSSVYLARDPQDHAFVALKVLYPTRHTTLETQRQTAQQEAGRLRLLAHPNIVPLRGHGEVDGAPYLSFPFIEGHSLDHVLQTGGMPPETALQMMIKVSRALQHAHGAGIIHRDLKPRNVLLDAGNEPCVLDWGLSWRRGDKPEKNTQNIVGTPAYMSPEQARGEEQKLTPASDVYSLGAILYHLLAGAPPFDAQTSWKTLQMAMSLPLRPPSVVKPSINPQSERVILWAMAKEPEKRYAEAGALASDLQRVLQGGIPRGPAGFLSRLFKKK
jgi:serine/threonine-protein kinase